MRKVLTFLSASLVLTWVAPVLAQQAPDQFKDVEPNHWAYQAMESLRAKGIVIGYPDGYFRGRRTLTRYEFAVALDRALNQIPAPGTGPAGPAGEAGAAGPAGEAGPAGKDYDPAELDALKKLSKEFKDELGSLGNSVNAVNAKLDALAKDVAAIKEAWDKAPKISGQAFIGIRGDRAAGRYVDRNGGAFGSSGSYYSGSNRDYEYGSVGTPFMRDPTVVHDLQIGIDAKIAGGATLAAKLNSSNYLGTLGGNYAQQTEYSFGGTGFDYYDYGTATRGHHGSSTKNANSEVWLDQLEIKAPLSGFGRDGSLSIGRFSVQGSKYMLWKPDVDTYFDNPIVDDGMYRVDGLKLTTKLGSLDLEMFGVQTKSVQTTASNRRSYGAGINTPVAGMDWMNVDQMVGLSGKLPVRFMSGGYVRLAALGLSNNTWGDDLSTVLVLGVDSEVKVSDRLGVNVDWAKSITGYGSFKTADGGAQMNNAVEGKVSYDAGKLKLAAGYKYIDPWFYTPGYWDRIGPWMNPTGVKGPTLCANYAISDNLSVKAGAEWLTGVTMDEGWLYPDEAINKITAGIRYNLSKTAHITLDWEGDYGKTDYYSRGEYTGFAIHPTMQYFNIGTGYNLTSSTTLKLGYEIGDFDGKRTNFLSDGPYHFNYNVFTTQVAVKF